MWRYIESLLNKPRVVAETSKVSWVGKNNGKAPKIKISDVIMDPKTHKQIVDIADRIRVAKKNGENFFNVLLYGEPGTGKTMFARALAYYSGLDYAVTSGSEFAKITDTNRAITELRKLIQWAEHSPKGVIVFIDEAESFLADRRLPSTTKWSQDMLNAFLAAVPKPTSDKIMFVFATNHPFKLDKAVVSRVGERVEFKLPAQPEREKIIRLYVNKFGKDKSVKVDKSFEDGLSEIAKELEGIAPREIEYFSDKVTSVARSENKSVLTLQIAKDVAEITKKQILAGKAWEIEQREWVEKQLAAAH
jgi:ATPase family AAA domain-containing protein 3A/B